MNKTLDPFRVTPDGASFECDINYYSSVTASVYLASNFTFGCFTLNKIKVTFKDIALLGLAQFAGKS